LEQFWTISLVIVFDEFNIILLPTFESEIAQFIHVFIA
jgi:hypothetical protein